MAATWPALTLLLLVGPLAPRAAAAAPGPLGPRAGDEAWLQLEQHGRPLGWAVETLGPAPAPSHGQRLSRASLVGEVEERLQVDFGAGPQPVVESVHYRRLGGGDAVAVTVGGGRIRWQVGRVGEEAPLPPGPPPLPTALLRLGLSGGHQRLLLEEYGAIAGAEVTVRRAPGETTVEYTLAGLRERVTTDDRGRLRRLTSAPAGVTARRLRVPPPAPLRARLSRPLPPLPGPTSSSWEEPTPALRALAARLGAPEATLAWTAAWPTRSDPHYRSASEVLARGAADCTGLATLAAALLRLQGVVVRHVVGSRTAGPATPPAEHQWLELRRPDGRWRAVDPDGSPVLPATHHPLLRLASPVTPRALLRAELELLVARGPR